MTCEAPQMRYWQLQPPEVQETVRMAYRAPMLSTERQPTTERTV